MIRSTSQQAFHAAESLTRAVIGARRRDRCRVVWLILIVGFGLSFSMLARAEKANPTREYKLKLAYIYQFTHYVSWPEQAFESPESPFVIAVLGDDPFGPLLDRLQQSRRAAGRPIVVRRFKFVPDAQEAHVLFVSRSAPIAQVGPLLHGPHGVLPTLVVCESDGLGNAGATVNLFLDSDGTVGIEVNVDAIARRGLKVDAKMLNISRVIRDKPISP